MGEQTTSNLHTMRIKSILLLGLLIATVNGSGFFSLPEESAGLQQPLEDNECQKEVRQMAMALKSCYENPVNTNEMNYPLGARIPRGKRSPGCMQRCVTGGMLHPAQCHSLC